MFQDRLASLSLLLAFIIILWVVQVVNLIMGYGLNEYGVVPRTIQGLARHTAQPLTARRVWAPSFPTRCPCWSWAAW